MKAINEKRYSLLLIEKLPRPIHSEKENERALKEVAALAARGDKLGSEEKALLELWVALIERFEEERYVLKKAKPRDILRELMAARDMTQSQVSKLFPSKGIASEALSGKREISKLQARKLAEFLHVPATLFLDVGEPVAKRKRKAGPHLRKAKRRAA
jgi:HTH-type transcriptional regulator/antitoxin HigA